MADPTGGMLGRDEQFSGDPYDDFPEDSVTSDVATARRWFEQDGMVGVNYRDGSSWRYAGGVPFPQAGVESYQREEA